MLSTHNSRVWLDMAYSTGVKNLLLTGTGVSAHLVVAAWSSDGRTNLRPYSRILPTKSRTHPSNTPLKQTQDYRILAIRWWRSTDLRLQPHRYPKHTGRLQCNTPQPKVHSWKWDQQQDKLPWPHHPKNRHLLENIHIQKTHFYGHNYPLLLQPPNPTQIGRHKVPVQQTEHIQPARERIQDWRKHYP